MKILQTVKKIPGGLMVVPLLLGAIINTLFGNVLWTSFDGTFTTYLWKSGAMPILAVFIFCNATTINFKRAGVTVYKGIIITLVKVGLGIIIGLIGSVIPLILLFILYNKVVEYILTRFSMLNSVMTFLNVYQVFEVLVPVALVLGMGIGLFGSIITIRKHLKV